MVEETSALTQCNLIPKSPNAWSERLNRFGEDRDAGGKVGERDGDNEDDDENMMPLRGSCEETPCQTDEEGINDGYLPHDPEGGSGGKVHVPLHQGTTPSHCSQNKCLRPPSSDWGDQCNSEGIEGIEGAFTQDEGMDEEKLTDDKNSYDADDEKDEDRDEEIDEESSPSPTHNSHCCPPCRSLKCTWQVTMPGPNL